LFLLISWGVIIQNIFKELSQKISDNELKFSNIKFSSILKFKTEILAGLTVALALVPEAVSFSFIAGVHPLVGLYAAFIVGLITALIGGRPGMISGATGALAVVMVALVSLHGVEYLFATVVLMGIFQIIAAFLRLGKFIRLVPYPVMLGFVNGLAIVIFLAQMSQFQVTDLSGNKQWMQGQTLLIMLLLVIITMVVIWGTPKITNIIPAPLAGIVFVAVLVISLDIDVPRVGDLASIKGGLPTFHIPSVPLNTDTFLIILPYALILATIGLIESLLTLNLVGDITGKIGGASQECVAQGIANMITGFFSGMGGCAMIGQSMINVKSGGRTRISGIMASLFLLLFIVVGSSLIEQIPLAALVGVMFMVVIGTFAWQSILVIKRIPRTDVVVMIIVTTITVIYDLAIAVICGVIVSALAYAWNNAIRITGNVTIDENGNTIYYIQGPLFFGSVQGFSEIFNIESDTDTVIVDFINSRVVDQSALQAIEDLAIKYEKKKKQLQLRHLSTDCHSLLRKAGQLVVDSDDDPNYGLAVDYGVKSGVFRKTH
jgi:SulP family sulfate permease|tara:strand:- start:3370 stop:5007 length:1638 start_codon:yes stop_codon:yes gene_type:complete